MDCLCSSVDGWEWTLVEGEWGGVTGGKRMADIYGINSKKKRIWKKKEGKKKEKEKERKGKKKQANKDNAKTTKKNEEENTEQGFR